MSAIAGSCLRRATSGLVGPGVLALALAAALPWWVRAPEGAGEEAANATGIWLHVPLFVLAAATVVALVDAWPLIGRDRADRALVARLRCRPLDGALAAAAGSLAAAAPWLVAAALGFAAVLAATGQAAAVRPVRTLADAPGQLAAAGDRIEWPAPDGALHSLRIRGTAVGVPGGAVELRVTADGEPLGEPLRALATEVWEVPLGDRRAERIALTCTTADRLSLWLLPGDARVELSRRHSPLVNAALAALSYLVPLTLALAVVCALRRSTTAPIAAAAGIATLLVASATEFGGNGAALRRFSRSEWLGDQLSAPGTFWSLSAAGLAILASVLSERWRR